MKSADNRPLGRRPAGYSLSRLTLMAAEGSQFISSRLVKEIGRLGGDITSFVTPRVAKRLSDRFAAEQAKTKRG